VAVITVSKEFSSGSNEFAQRLADKLGYQVVGKRILMQLAEKLDMSEAQVELLKRGQDARWIKLVDSYLLHTVRKIAQRPEAALDDERYFQAVQSLVNDVAQRGKVIILGWGGQLILGFRPDTLHLRVVAPLEMRARRLADHSRINLEQARLECQRQDDFSRDYVQHFLHHDWDDSALYHLTINMGALGFNFDKALRLVQDLL